MSRAMQKRIARARAEGERQAQQRFAEEDAENKRQISDLRRQVHGLTIGDKVSKEEAKHLQEMQELEAALEKAHTDGDHTKIASIQAQLATKAASWETRKRELLATPPEQQQQRRSNTNDGPTPEGRAWIAANAEWYGRPGYEAETASAIAIDQRLMQQGSNPNSPDHYKAIQKELRKKFRDINVVSPDGDDDEDEREELLDEDGKPRKRGRGRERDEEDEDEEIDDDEERDDDDSDDEDQDDDHEDDADEDDEEDRGDRRRQSRSPAFMNMGGEGEGNGRRDRVKVRGGRVVLSERDRQTMAKFNLDPDNDKHVEQWARTKREIANDRED